MPCTSFHAVEPDYPSHLITLSAHKDQPLFSETCVVFFVWIRCFHVGRPTLHVYLESLAYFTCVNSAVIIVAASSIISVVFQHSFAANNTFCVTSNKFMFMSSAEQFAGGRVQTFSVSIPTKPRLTSEPQVFFFFFRRNISRSGSCAQNMFRRLHYVETHHFICWQHKRNACDFLLNH